MNHSPSNMFKVRLECLKLAASLADPDKPVSPSEVIQKAETLFRYVLEGGVADNVVKIAV